MCLPVLIRSRTFRISNLHCSEVATAWASDIVTCQTLEYAGPTKQQTIDFHQFTIDQTRSTHAGQLKPAQNKEWDNRLRIVQQKIQALT